MESHQEYLEDLIHSWPESGNLDAWITEHQEHLNACAICQRKILELMIETQGISFFTHPKLAELDLLGEVPDPAVYPPFDPGMLQATLGRKPAWRDQGVKIKPDSLRQVRVFNEELHFLLRKSTITTEGLSQALFVRTTFRQPVLTRASGKKTAPILEIALPAVEGLTIHLSVEAIASRFSLLITLRGEEGKFLRQMQVRLMGDPERTTTTDADNQAVFKNLPPSLYTLEIRDFPTEIESRIWQVYLRLGDA